MGYLPYWAKLMNSTNTDYDKLEKDRNLINLKSLNKKESCITKKHQSNFHSISNKPLYLQSSGVITTDL